MAARRSAGASGSAGRRQGRLGAHHEGDHDTIEGRRQKAGDQRRHEQLGDVLLGRDRIDDQDDGRRNEDAESAADRDGAGGEARLVSDATKLRQRGAGEGRRGGDRRAADCAERRARADERHGQPTAKSAECDTGSTKQVGRETRALGHRAHQNEKRDDGERVVGELVIGVRLHVREKGRPARQVDIADGAGDEHRQADRHTDGDEQQHCREPDGGGGKSAHGRPRISRTAPTSVTIASTAHSRAQMAMAGQIGSPSTIVVVPFLDASKAPLERPKESSPANAA